jgi:hypothetical protein
MKSKSENKSKHKYKYNPYSSPGLICIPEATENQPKSILISKSKSNNVKMKKHTNLNLGLPTLKSTQIFYKKTNTDSVGAQIHRKMKP